MIKILSIFGSVVLIFISSYFFDSPDPVTILPFVPSGVEPGDAFVVELTVNKGNIKGVANLQQYLPEGFTATPVETNHGSFSFKEQLVRFVWIELPREKSFKISYRVQTDKTCNGLKTLNGDFSYLENDKVNKISLTPSVLMLSHDMLLTQSPHEAGIKMVVEKITQPSAEHSGNYDVRLKIKKGIQEKGVRIYNPIPAGYLAESEDAHGAKFTVSNGFVEFYWETMPEDSLFNISYHIFPSGNQPVQISVQETTAENNTGSSSSDQLKATNAEISKNKGADDPYTTGNSRHTSSSYVSIPAPQKGIYYKVQIAATRSSPDRNSSFFKTKWNIDQPVDLAMHEGWQKYLIGTFEKYSTAKQFSVQTRSTVPDAFVVAFNAGKRIPLQESSPLSYILRNQ